MFRIGLAAGRDKYFSKLGSVTQDKIMKKISQLEVLEGIRHLRHGTPYFVAEPGQYRICFEEIGKMRQIFFVGDHKQYEKWYKRE